MKKLNRTKMNSALNKSQDIKNKSVLTPNNNGGSSSLISTMKMQLSSIKQDVQKLMKDDVQVVDISQPSKEQYVQNNASYYKKQNDSLRNKCNKILEQLTQTKQYQIKLEEQIQKFQQYKSQIEKVKLKLQTDNCKLQSQKTKAQKQHIKIKQQRQKYFNQKIDLEKVNQRLIAQIQKFKIKALKNEEEQKWKLAWIELSSQVTILEQELKVKQSEIQTKDQQILKLNWQIDDLNNSNKDSQQQFPLQIKQQNDELKKTIEQMNKKQQLDSSSFQQYKTQKYNEIVSLQSDIQKLKTQIDLVRTENRHLLSDKSKLEQTLRSTIQENKINDNNIKDQIKGYLSEITKYRTKITQQEALTSKLQQTIAIKEVNSSHSINKIKQAELLHQINDKNNQIVVLKSQLEQTKKALNFAKTQSQTEKIKVVSGQNKIKNHLEIELINKKSQIQSMKRKMDASNKKVESRTAELRQKDQFIVNTIINKISRQSTQTEVQYIKTQLSKHFSIQLGQKLITAEKEIQELKNKIENIQKQVDS